jgi:hypothetical protein
MLLLNHPVSAFDILLPAKLTRAVSGASRLPCSTNIALDIMSLILLVNRGAHTAYAILSRG